MSGVGPLVLPKNLVSYTGDPFPWTLYTVLLDRTLSGLEWERNPTGCSERVWCGLVLHVCAGRNSFPSRAQAPPADTTPLARLLRRTGSGDFRGSSVSG